MIFVVSVDVEEIPLKGHVIDYSTVVKGVPVLLDLFHDLAIPATFFVTRNAAKNAPDTITEIVKRNHEVACHGEHLDPTCFQSAEKQHACIKSATETIIEYVRVVPVGFRAPFNRINEETIKALIKLGYQYDSSVMPSSKLLSRYYYPKAPKAPYKLSLDDLCQSGSFPLVEIPICTLPVTKVPLGLSYLKLLGLNFFRLFLANFKQEIVMFYLHTYDLFSLPSHMDLPLHFRLMYKRANGFEVLKNFLAYVSEAFAPKYVSARRVLEYLDANRTQEPTFEGRHIG